MADNPIKTTHAQRRRAEAHAAVGKRLRAGKFVRWLQAIAHESKDADPVRIPAMKLRADIYLKLLAKCLPDLRAIEHSGNVTTVRPDELSDGELTHIASSGSPGDVEPPVRKPEPGAVH